MEKSHYIIVHYLLYTIENYTLNKDVWNDVCTLFQIHINVYLKATLQSFLLVLLREDSMGN